MASPSPQVASALATVSEKFNIPLWHLYAVANRESSFDPNAVNGWDGWAGSGYPGTGLFQLSGEHWSAPNINPGENRDFVSNIFKPGDFSTLSNARDPLQNATRYAEYASRWYHYLHQKYPSWSSDQLWDGVAYNWNKGLYADPAGALTNQDYLATYHNYADSYKQDIATFGRINTGGPTMVGGMSGPVAAAAPPPKTPQQLREEAIGLAQTLGAQRNAMLRPTIGASVQQGRPGMALSTQNYRLPSMALRSQSDIMPSIGLGSGGSSLIPKMGLSSGLRQVMAPLGLSMARPMMPALGLASSFLPKVPLNIGGGLGATGNFLGNVGEAALQRIYSSARSPWEGFYNGLKSIF